MKNAVALVFALLFALAPVANDVCGMECARPAAAECPLHHQPAAPTQCNHDHSSLRANVVRTTLVAPMFDFVGITAPLVVAPPPLAGTVFSQPADGTPPLRASRSTVLRI